jgi:uncharacterized radical SAM superfamily Fe-S cluster-containing enzyme
MLTSQLPEWFTTSDFFPVPCCFPTCRSITYVLTDGEEVIPLPRLVDLEEHLDYVTNRVLPDPQLRLALERLWSASAFPGTDATEANLDCVTCGIDLPTALTDLTDLADKAFMIVIQDFQDPYTLNVKQLMKCCVEQITPDGRIIPFCAYNSVGYREQVRAQMSGVPIPEVVPNALPLQPMLTDGPYGSKTATNGAQHGPHGRRADATNVGERLR